MKKFAIVAILSLVLHLAGQAQVRPLLEEGKMWAVSVIGPITYTTVVLGDTLIDGVAYKNVYETWKKDLEGLELSRFAREENGRVYLRSKDAEREGFLFDFNAKLGDDMLLERSVCGDFPGYDLTVIGKVIALRDTLFCDSVSRRAWDVRVRIEGVSLETGEVIEPEVVGEFTFIEEIGLADWGLSYYIFDSSMTGNFGSEILCVHDGRGNLILDAGKGCYLGKEEPDGIGRTLDADASGAPLYDLSGRKLRAVPLKGVYIQGGKKRMK